MKWKFFECWVLSQLFHSLLSLSTCNEVMGLDAMIFISWMLSFKPALSFSFFTFIKRLLSSSSLSAIRWCHLHIWGYWYFSWQSWFQLVFLPVQHFSWCTLQHSENEDHGIRSNHFMGNRWGNSRNSVRLYFWGAPKSLQMVTAAMKLKDAYSLEEKWWPT